MSDITYNPAQRAIVFLAILAGLYTLHTAKAVLLPITLAVIFALIFSPIVNALAKRGIARSLSAVAVLTLSLGLIGGGGYLLAEPALGWLQRAPEAVDVVEKHLQSFKGDVSKVEAATESMESMESIQKRISPDEANQQKIVIQENNLRTRLVNAVTTFATFGGLSIILIFFLLTSGQKLLKRFIQTLPSKSDKQQTIEIARAAQKQMSRYLTTISVVNFSVGLITATALWLIDFPDPLLWGTAAAVLRFVPYAGVALTVGVLAVIGAITYASPWLILSAPLGYLTFTSFVGQVIDPLVHGYRFSLNPIVVFVWIFFWGWLWGAAGILLAVPLLTLFQVICQQTPKLQPVAHIISEAHASKED